MLQCDIVTLSSHTFQHRVQSQLLSEFGTLAKLTASQDGVETPLQIPGNGWALLDVVAMAASGASVTGSKSVTIPSDGCHTTVKPVPPMPALFRRDLPSVSAREEAWSELKDTEKRAVYARLAYAHRQAMNEAPVRASLSASRLLDVLVVRLLETVTQPA